MTFIEKIDFIIDYEKKNVGKQVTDISNCKLVEKVYQKYASGAKNVKTEDALGQKFLIK